MTDVTVGRSGPAYLDDMTVMLIAIGALTIVGAFLAGGASNSAVRHHLEHSVGDFGSRSVTRSDAEFRTLLDR